MRNRATEEINFINRSYHDEILTLSSSKRYESEAGRVLFHITSKISKISNTEAPKGGEDQSNMGQKGVY